MQHNGVAKKRKTYINKKISKELCEELENRAFEQGLGFSEYLEKLMGLEDAKAFFVDSTFAEPLKNILKAVQKQAQAKQEENNRESFKW